MSAPMTRGTLKPAKITNLSTQETVHFMFNPYEFTISKKNEWTSNQVNGANVPRLTFDESSAQDLTLNIYFDTTRSPVDERVSVRAFTAPLWKMMMIDADNIDQATRKGQPPSVAFEWGELYFKAVIKSLNENFLVFDPQGVPLRSKVTISLQQYVDEADLRPQISNQLPNESVQATHQMQEGNRLDLVAAENGQGSGGYRQIAEKNNIDNPMRVPNGTQIKV